MGKGKGDTECTANSMSQLLDDEPRPGAPTAGPAPAAVGEMRGALHALLRRHPDLFDDAATAPLPVAVRQELQELRGQVGDLLEDEEPPREAFWRLLGFDGQQSSMPDAQRAAMVMMTRWLRAKGWTKGSVRSWLKHHFDRGAPHVRTLDAWCAPAAFDGPWASRTESQPLRDGHEEYEAQRRRWARLAKELHTDHQELQELSRPTSSSQVQQYNEEMQLRREAVRAARRQVKDALEAQFHKVGLHQLNGPNRQDIEEMFGHGTAAELLERIADAHVYADIEGSTLVEKPFEQALRSAFNRGAGLYVQPEDDRSDDFDARLVVSGSAGRDLTVQIKTHAAYTAVNQQEHREAYENETSGFGFTMLNTGEAKASDTVQMARDASKRISGTDLYVLADIIHENGGLTPDDRPDTVKYAINTLRPEVQRALRQQLMKHDFQDGPCRANGYLELDGRRVPWQVDAVLYGNSVQVKNIPAACMESVLTVSVPAPHVCEQLVRRRAAKLLARRRERQQVAAPR